MKAKRYMVDSVDMEASSLGMLLEKLLKEISLQDTKHYQAQSQLAALVDGRHWVK